MTNQLIMMNFFQGTSKRRVKYPILPMDGIFEAHAQTSQTTQIRQTQKDSYFLPRSLDPVITSKADDVLDQWRQSHSHMSPSRSVRRFVGRMVPT